MDTAMERIIAESLDALESGRSIEEILADHPGQSETLRPVLATAANLGSLKIAHSVGAQSSSLDQFLAVASAKGAAGAGGRSSFWIFGRRLAVSLSAILLLLIVTSFSVTLAAQSAIPGDALYGPKEAIEDFRISLLGEGPSREKLASEFNQNRIEEIEELIASGRSASGIEFRGRIESIDGGSWVISGLPINVSSSLMTSVRFEVGHSVIVIVDVKNGEAEAVTIVRTSRLDAIPEPEPATTKVPEEAVDPDPEPSPTLKVSPTATDVPTETPEPTITATPVPDEIADPEETPTPEGDDHDGDDDGSEDEDSGDSSGSGEEEEDEEDSEGSGSGSDESDSDDDRSGSSGEEEEDSGESGSGSDESDSDDDHSGSSEEEEDEEGGKDEEEDEEEDDEEEKGEG